MFTARKYAERIGVSRSVVNEWLRQGMPYSISSAGHRVINPFEAEKWLIERQRSREPGEAKAATSIPPIASVASTLAAKVTKAVSTLGVAGQTASRVTGRTASVVAGTAGQWFSRRAVNVSKLRKSLSTARLQRGFSLALIPYDAAGKVVQFAFNRRMLRILFVLAILGGFAIFFLLGLAAAIPSLNRTIKYQDMVIEAYAVENEELRMALEDALGIQERFDVIEDILSEPVAEPQARVSALQEENPNVPVPQEVKSLVQQSNILQFFTAELADEMVMLSARVEEYAEKAEATPNMWPAAGRVTSGYGVRPAVFGSFMSRGRDGEEVLITHTFHEGVDIAGKRGTPIYATAGGTVTFADNEGSWGNKVVIDHEHGYVTVYAHLDSIHVAEGDTVMRGQVIGEMGDSGRTTGVHCHYEVRLRGVAVDPMRYVP